jgi:hypothetical protein
MSNPKVVEPPPPTASDSEVMDWFLHKARLSGPPAPTSSLPKDVRGVALKNSLSEVLSRMAAIVPCAEDVKNPFDYWSFVEPIFSPALRPSLIPESGIFSTPLTVPGDQSIHYTWTWAMEDCLDLSKLTASEIEAIKAALPVVDGMENSQVNLELARTTQALDETTKQAATLLQKLHKWLRQLEKMGDFSKTRNASLTALMTSAERILVQLQKEQLLDSIEELHNDGEGHVAVVIDDADRVRCYRTSSSDVVSILQERDATLEGPQAESIQYKYPFASKTGACPRLPQLGPFCHICRQSKPAMARCTNKLSIFYGDVKDFKAVCHRRYCIDCLVAYNWPKPAPEASANYKCPICAKLCTCDRCVRNVFLKSMRTFIAGLKCEPSNSVAQMEAPPLSAEATYISGIRDFFNIVGDMSAFTVTPATPSLESPTSDAPPIAFPPAGRLKRQSGSLKKHASADDLLAETVKPNLSRSSSRITRVKSEKNSPSETASDEEKESSFSSPGNQMEGTPPSDRKRRKAASVADTLLRSQRK